MKARIDLYPEDSIVRLVQLACGKAIEKLVAVTRMQLKTLTAVYRFEVSEERAWLLGVEECVMRRERKEAKETITMNVISLHIEQNERTKRSESFIIVPKQEDWPEHRLSPPALRLFSRPHLKPCLNRSLFGPSQRVRNSRLNRSLQAQSRTDVLKKLKEVHTNSVGEKCGGLFCDWQGVFYRGFLPYNRRSRFRVPLELIEAAKKQEFSPIFNAKLLASPEKPQVNHQKSLSLGQFEAANTVPVCLRCYFVYQNVAKAVHMAKDIAAM